MIDERDAAHIFRNAAGHVPDTPANRLLLISTVDPAWFLGNDRFGNSWYARILGDGKQVWVQVRHGRIRNGGFNPVPRAFDLLWGYRHRRNKMAHESDTRPVGEKQAYLAMLLFLERQYGRTGSEDLGALVGSASLLADGRSADPAMLDEWRTCLDAVRRENAGSQAAE